MPHETKLLSADQYLLTTLMVKLAVMAVLATMLVRFPWFRRILLTEKRDWPERLIFAASLGVPLTAGVVARLLLNYKAADLTLAGSFLAGLLAGPVRRRHRRRHGRHSGDRRRRMDRASVRGRLRVRRRRPARDLPEGSDLALLAALLHRPAPQGLAPGQPLPDRVGRDPARRADRRWRSCARLLGRTSTTRTRTRIFYLAAPTMWLYALVVLTTVLCVTIPIKIWNSARIEHRLQEQEKLLMAARVEALASQINPHFLFNTLTSISSLIRSQPETARMLIVKLSALLRRLLRSQEHFVTLREELEADRRVPRHRSGALRSEARIEKAISRRQPRRGGAEHAAAAARRELDQARPVAEGRRRPHHHPQRAPQTATRSSTSSTTASASTRIRPARSSTRRGHRPAQRQRATCRSSTAPTTSCSWTASPARARAPGSSSLSCRCRHASRPDRWTARAASDRRRRRRAARPRGAVLPPRADRRRRGRGAGRRRTRGAAR